jgi:hypothetical protein
MADTFDWPTTLRPKSVEWQGPIVPQAVSRSVFDGGVQAQVLGAPRWAFNITTGVVPLALVPEWEAFIQRLRGATNRVRAWDWRREAPLGPAGGTPVVRVSALGATVATEGWTPGVAGILRAGSYLGVGGELKRLSVTADSDSLGRATLAFEPPLRAAPTVGSAIALVKPTAVFYLTTERPAMPQDGSRNTGWTLSFEEDLSS